MSKEKEIEQLIEKNNKISKNLREFQNRCSKYQQAIIKWSKLFEQCELPVDYEAVWGKILDFITKDSELRYMLKVIK